jgi:UDP-GlcNAc:undecaprenyl-phosphate GlcNAc-1-phosphate transferase
VTPELWAHLAVAVLAAVVTAVAAPWVGKLAVRIGAVETPPDVPGERRTGVPSMGGVAMLLGLFAAMGLAWLLPGFEPLFTTTSEPLALLVGAVVIVAVGIADDVLVLPPTIKLAGQIVAALCVVVLGIQLVFFYVPLPGAVEIIALSPDVGVPLTILALVAMINAVNLIDGLDGLAAGVTAIGGIAFFLFAERSRPAGFVEAVPTSATLVAVIVAGIAIGFLVHNWHPARLFMGDTGAMLLGLLLGAAGVSYVGRSTVPSNADFYGAIPLLVPALVLAIPFLDSAFAVARRLVARRPITAGDRGHLHHLLLAFGHSHRRAVLVLCYWSAVLAFGSVGPAFLPVRSLVPWVLVAALVGIGLTALGVRASDLTDEDTEAGRDAQADAAETTTADVIRPTRFGGGAAG